MTFDELKEKAHSLPLKPGVYIMQNAQSEVIYVGKAKALKNRVSQYFANLAAHTEKTRAMVSQIDHFDVIIADSEFEALILENSLIKRHQPRYNILLKDDKGYPYIRLSREEYPRFSLAGRVAEDGARYCGPYGSRHSTQGILDALRTALRLPSCRKKFPRDIGKERPCLNFHMGKCDGYCRSEELKERHDEAIRQAVSLLEGRFKEVKADLTAEMERAAEELRFEQAAQLRDRLRAIELLGARQKVVAGSLADTDVTGFFRGTAKSCFVVLHYVDGDLAAKDMELLETPVEEDEEEILSSLVRENLKLTGLSQQARVVQGDSISFLMSCREKFDVIFLDPPYLTGALEKAVETVSAFDILREHGIMVCESPLEQELPALAAPYERGKEYRYGKIKLTVYRHLGGEDRR